MDDDLRICGTARGEMARVRAEGAAQRAFRLFAKHGNNPEILQLLEQAQQLSDPDNPSLAVAVDYVQARLTNSNSNSNSNNAADRSAIDAKSKDLDDWIAKLESRAEADSRNEHNILAIARSKTCRALLAMVLDDDAHAETLYQEAIAHLSSIAGDDNLEVGNYCEDYATLLFKMGRLQEANAYVARACAITTNAGFTHDDRG